MQSRRADGRAGVGEGRAGSAGAPPGRRIVVSGFYGAINVGDEAVYQAVVRGIRSAVPDSRLSVVTASASSSRGFSDADIDFLEGFYPSATFWRGFPRYLRTLRDAELCVVGGGGIFQDVHSWKSATRHLITASIAILLGRPVVTVGLGVGPLRRPWLSRLIGWISSGFALIQVRDDYSRDALVACGVPPELVRVTADVVPSLPGAALPERAAAPDGAPRRVGFAMRRWPGLSESGLVRLWETLAAEGTEIWLLCYEPRSDRKFYEELVARLPEASRERIRIHSPETLEDALRAVGEMEAMVSMRLHGCVFSAAAGIPFLAVPYDPKVASFVEELGCGEWRCRLEDVGPECRDRLLEIAGEVARDRTLLPERFGAVRRDAARNFEPIAGAARLRPSPWQRLRMLPAVAFLLGIGLATVVREERYEIGHRLRGIPRRIARTLGFSAAGAARRT